MAEYQAEEDSGEDETYDPEAPAVGNWKKVDLPQVPVVTGEEEEEVLFKVRSKVYRYRGEWKERGVGDLKLLRHHQSGLVRLLVRADKTHKCVLNHLLQRKDSFCVLTQLKTSNNAWTWAAYDVSDDAPRCEKFCAKFTSKEDYDQFQHHFNKFCTVNEEILAKKVTLTQKPAEIAQKKVEQKVQIKKEEIKKEEPNV